jgi:hypothetical protein
MLITASIWEVGMGLVPEDRAIALSDEPEARSDARWRELATDGTPNGIAERWPALGPVPRAVRWLGIQLDLGRSPRTVRRTPGRSLTTWRGVTGRGSRSRRRVGRRSPAMSVISASVRGGTARM